MNNVYTLFVVTPSLFTQLQLAETNQKFNSKYIFCQKYFEKEREERKWKDFLELLFQIK